MSRLLNLTGHRLIFLDSKGQERAVESHGKFSTHRALIESVPLADEFGHEFEVPVYRAFEVRTVLELNHGVVLPLTEYACSHTTVIVDFAHFDEALDAFKGYQVIAPERRAGSVVDRFVCAQTDFKINGRRVCSVAERH
jgi:hypothetical protein